MEAAGAGLSAAWSAVSAALVPPAALGLAAARCDPVRPLQDAELRAALEVLRCYGLHAAVEEWFLEVLQTDLQAHIAPEFWNCVGQYENTAEEQQCSALLLDAFCLLKCRLEPYLSSMELLEGWTEAGLLLGTGAQTLREKVYTMFKAILFFSTTKPFQEMIQQFYSRTFRIYMRQWKKGEEGMNECESSMSEAEQESDTEEGGGESAVCAGCGSRREQCWCPTAMERFRQLNHILRRLNLLERVSADAVTTILHRMIKERMERRCRGEYEHSFLNEFQEWIEKVLGWLSRVFLQDGPLARPSAEASSTLRRWRCHVQRFFYRIYASMLIEELFSIIRDFPESKPAVEDLKFCLERTNLRQQLLSSLKSALEIRLLHPGVNTSDIITLYISAIKALRELDPSMVILEVACEPIRKYLRTREDTVRQIVAGLTGDAEGSGDLANELSKADPVTLENGQESDDDISEPGDWVPDPVDADPGKSSSKRRSSDIISLLVSIYGSKDLFINEYRTLLADRLLHQFNYSAEREIRNVELLKLRFGEAQMHYCEVMLKDMADSRRINANIRDEEEKLPEEERPPFSLVAVILSSEFWPPLKEEKLELPEQVKEAMEAYSKKYEKLKAMRTLNWKYHLGLVSLDVELADRTLSLSVSPVHAAIILHFQTKSTWTLAELSEVLKVPVTSLKRKMTLWLQQGVLREEPPGTFTVIEEEQKDQGEKVVLIDSDEEGDSAMASQADQKEEELQLFWTYIQAMLTNLESLSLERIHSMLKMFVMTGPVVTEIDIQELQGFLQKKVRDQQLIYSGGVYRLPKNCN
ncbi:anaphase-promoting complex subunit 2 [Gallus gallus]|uniref:Anaphase-promoting complex subunit 2 n=1 Tax=Gallus gallus TaxID=9031 RepID=F1NLT0_CHICK|nr:anaphase-promoting complex subunit 2 [Gallus gallus]XP_415533.2 anaphase-promoting complex subunit 2 [Gallus gallus]|eukprot:XP_415533.2 anaphase-promoting complex subunit 2 [Gallus gallus]